MKNHINFNKRKKRIRFKISQCTSARVRLSVYRSGKHIYAQLIDDAIGKTLVSASSLEGISKEIIRSGCNIGAAEFVGNLIAEKANKVGIKKVVFDRGGFIYKGKIEALANKARDAGLEF